MTTFSMTHLGPGVLLLFFSAVCYVRCTPLPPSNSNTCPRENAHSSGIEVWPNGIVPFTMSSNLTDNMQSELMKAMSVWENRICIAFIPRHQQEQEMEHFVHFVPGERCCTHRGRVGRSGQNVYIHESCVSDGTLENVIGELIGNSRQGTSDDSVPGLAIPGSLPETNTTSEWNLTATQNECQNTRIRHIVGKLNGRSRLGHIYSPNHPMEYPSNVECVWKITVPDNAVLQLTFQEFDTECSHDYLEIHFMKTEEGTVESHKRLCGALTGRDAITSHLSVDTVLLRFHTDTTYNNEGFDIFYKFIENKHPCDINNGSCSYKCETDKSGIGNCVCEPGYRVSRNGSCKDINECNTNSHGCEQNCDNVRGSYQCFCNRGYALSHDRRSCNRCEEDFNETEGDIGLVGYPGPYEDQQNCLYTISILPEHILKLTLTVDIQPSPSCRTEFLKLEHGYFAHNRRLCGFISHISYYIKENVTSTQLRFRTRDLNSVKLNRISGGFEGYYQQFPRSSVSEEEIERVEIGSNTKSYQDRPWWSYHVE